MFILTGQRGWVVGAAYGRISCFLNCGQYKCAALYFVVCNSAQKPQPKLLTAYSPNYWHYGWYSWVISKLNMFKNSYKRERFNCVDKRMWKWSAISVFVQKNEGTSMGINSRWFALQNFLSERKISHRKGAPTEGRQQFKDFWHLTAILI